jgi:hypothetical protein
MKSQSVVVQARELIKMKNHRLSRTLLAHRKHTAPPLALQKGLQEERNMTLVSQGLLCIASICTIQVSLRFNTKLSSTCVV